MKTDPMSWGHKSTNPVIGVAASILLPPNPKRIGFWFCPTNSAAVTWTISFGEPAVSGAGFCIKNTDPPVWISIHQMGEAITRQINVVGTAGPVGVGVVEVFEA